MTILLMALSLVAVGVLAIRRGRIDRKEVTLRMLIVEVGPREPGR